jgi:hypothetical protein
VANLKQLLKGAVAQINPFDNGATFSTVTHNQPPPNPPASVVHQITHNGVTNAAGSILNNFTGIPSAIDAARLGVAEMTHNQPAIDNATVSLAKNLPRFLPISLAEGFKPFAQDVATAVTAPYAAHEADQAAAYAQHMLNDHTGNPVHDSAVDAYASNMRTNLLNSHLGTAGIDMNTPTSTVIRKVGGNAASTAINAATAGELPGLNKGSVLKNALAFGGLNAASGVAATAGEDNPKLIDYLKNGGAGFATGAALPVAMHYAPEVASAGAQFAHDAAPAVRDFAVPSRDPAVLEGGYVRLPARQPPSTGFDAGQYVKEQTAAQKAASSEKGSALGRLRQEFAVKGIDALTPVEQPVEQAVGGRDQNVTLRNQLDRSLRSDTIAGQYVKDNGLDKLIQGVKDTKSFDQYLLAKHALDLEANGIKTGRDVAKDTALVNGLAPTYEPQAQQLQAYNQKLLDKTVDYGLISKGTADFLKQKYPNYVPFDRIFSDQELQNARTTGGGIASLSKQDIIQRIKGSERQVHSPLESILAKTHDVIAQGERNQAAKAIADTINLPDNPLGLKELKPGETIGNRPTISFLDNGIKRVFETTPEVAAAAKSLNQQQLGLVGKILSYPTRILRLGATGVNVGFTLANVAKDTVSAFINSQHPLRTSVANPKVFVDALLAAVYHKSPEYAELVREGAGGTSFDIARNNAPATLKEIRAGRNVGSKALYTVTHPGELLRAVEDTIGRSEEFGRALQYYGNKQAALKAGKSTAEATAHGADAARNNTVNFARAGEYGRVLNSVLPYFNAGLQGSRTLLRNLRDHPVQTSAKIAVASFMPVAVTTAWNLSDPKRKAAYDDIQDYEKQGNIIIVPPNPKKDASGRWNVIKIPVSQEIANLNNVVRNGVEALQKDKNFNFAELAGNLTGTVTSLNTQSPRQVIGQLTPQGIKPAIEALTNQNLFTGNPIVPDSKKDLAPADQYGNNTSGVAKVVGHTFNLSPYQIDNAIKTGLGGAGQNAVNIADSALAKAGIINPNEVKGRSFEQSVTNRFTSAQGQSEYAGVDKLIQAKLDELKKSPQYQAMSPEDKAKALTRLKNAALKAGQNALGIKTSSGTVPKVSPREAGLVTGSTDVQSFLKNQTGTIPKASNLSAASSGILDKYAAMDSQQRKTYLNDPKNEYQYNLAKFENDTKRGNLSDVQRFQQMQSLYKQKLTSQYPRQVLDLYSLSKPELAAYLRTNNVSSDTISQLQSLDQQLAGNGVINRPKYAYGMTGSGSGSRRGRSVSMRRPRMSFSSRNYHSRGAGGRISLKVPKLSARVPTISKVRLRKQTVKLA